MTEQELKAIEERWAKATPGPWECVKYNEDSPKMHGKAFSYKPAYLQPLNIRLSEDETGWDNATAIAAAPTDITALLAEVRRLKVENKLLDHRRRFSYREQSKKYLSILRLKREVRRLNGQIKAMIDPENLPHQWCPVEEYHIVQELKKQNTTFCKDCPRAEDDFD